MFNRGIEGWDIALKFSISNIAWAAHDDERMFKFLSEHGFGGLEIAPTRIFPVDPYLDLMRARRFADHLRKDYSLVICSMQSIWFGRSERVFGTAEDRRILTNYTELALCFAEAVGVSNLVFGNPKNRRQDSPNLMDASGLDFMREIAEAALCHGTIISLEPNPETYGTNWVTSTLQAFDLVRAVNHPALRVNFDLGTVLINGEDLSTLADNFDLIHHVHVSEPGLEPVVPRAIHRDLARILSDHGYDGWISIEMKNCGSLDAVESAAGHLREVFP